MHAIGRIQIWLLVAVVLGCGPGRLDNAAGDAGGPTGETVRGPAKTITLVQLNPVISFSSEGFSNTAGGGASLAEIHVNGLVTSDRVGGNEARLAARIPSLDDGAIRLRPDGTMTTSWALRPGVKWHDGAPFSAADMSFSWEVATDPAIPMTGSADAINALIDGVEVLDPLTLLITWKTPYFHAVELGPRELWPLPRHLLAAPHQGDKEVFLNLPYWTTQYIHLGPFRLVDFGLGEVIVFERFEDYFLGRPKVDRVTIRAIGDPNTVLANLKAGAIDIVSEMTLPFDVSVALREEWERTGDGIVLSRQGNWWYYRIQFEPEWGRPVEMTHDVRIRRALIYGLDRDLARETVFPGLPDTNADTFMPKSDPRAPLVGAPFARYPFDRGRAFQELADAGWRQASDSRLLNRDGQQMQIEIRGTANNVKEIALAADFWRQIGIDAKESPIPRALQQDGEYRTKFPGVEFTARASGDQIFAGLDGRLHAGPLNRWNGANRARYLNPALDAQIDKLRMSIGEGDQARTLKEMGEVLATDLPVVPLYFAVNLAAVRKGVRALVDDYCHGRLGCCATSRWAHGGAGGSPGTIRAGNITI
ncbi:MAG: hypothetical protein HW416_1634 [Chloroflexi bacterium]|nr:hypothetical protein [Chloroflexota bacterium]